MIAQTSSRVRLILYTLHGGCEGGRLCAELEEREAALALISRLEEEYERVRAALEKELSKN